VARDRRVHDARPDPQGPRQDRGHGHPEGLRGRHQHPREARPDPPARRPLVSRPRLHPALAAEPPAVLGLPSDYKTIEPTAAVGVDCNWDDWFSTSSWRREACDPHPEGHSGRHHATAKSTAVIRNNNIDTLITISKARGGPSSRWGTAKLDFGKIFTTVAEVFYSYDGNQSRYEREGEDPETSNFKYVFGEFNQLGINVTLQCRF
jgi:hypothetical protein